MRIALLGPTVGQTNRGYERVILGTFAHVRSRVDVTLFKGAGEAAPGEVVVPHVRRMGLLQRLFGARLRYPRNLLEFASFAAAMAPRLVRGRYDIIHFVDPPLAPWLHRIRRASGDGARLLFTDAGPAPTDAWKWADHVHVVTPEAFETTQAAAGAGRVTMIPLGIELERLRVDTPRAVLRQQAGVSEDTVIVLAVTSFNRHHKRVDYLIDEVARVDGDLLLWMDANVYPDGDPQLLEYARARLGPRFRHTTVPSAKVAELYAMADVFVSTALHETFGLAIVEAACTGLPVVTHDSPHFRWLVGDAGTCLDMSRPGALTEWLTRALREREWLRPRDRQPIRQRFGWPALAQDYVEMYQRVMAGSARQPAVGERAGGR